GWAVPRVSPGGGGRGRRVGVHRPRRALRVLGARTAGRVAAGRGERSMTTLIVVGAQWGDEGKGKVVDYLASQAELVARYAGGNNAGHALVIGGRKLVTHLVPSGCAYPGTPCVLGAGMVLDIDVFRGEVED